MYSIKELQFLENIQDGAYKEPELPSVHQIYTCMWSSPS